MISVFIPCYNEEMRLEKNVLIIYKALKELKKPFELIIVNDSSIDKTGDVGKNLKKKYKEIAYQWYDNGPSRRENLGKAFRTARGEIVAFMDLDLSADLSSLARLIDGAEKNDIAIGSRYKEKHAQRTLKRRIISTIYNVFMKIYFHSTIKDHQCGFKAFKKEKLLQLLNEMGYEKTRGWFWDVELLVRAQRKGYSIDEFPVEWKEGKLSSFNIQRELRMLPYVLKLKWKL
jgi:glycosyltransferase involved in cell wall biosynthesis